MKSYIEKQYKQAIREYKGAIDENARWVARKQMARLEALGAEMYGFEFADALGAELRAEQSV